MDVNKNSQSTVRKSNKQFNSFNARTSSKPAFQAKTPLDNAKKDIKYAVKKASGKYVKFTESGAYGLLVGAAMYCGWPAYILVDRDRKVQFIESTDKFDVIDYDINLSVLNYLRNYDTNFIEELVKENVNISVDSNGLLTPIVVKRQANNQEPRNNKKFKAHKSVKKSK
jgi:hypothetical protein